MLESKEESVVSLILGVCLVLLGVVSSSPVLARDSDDLASRANAAIQASDWSQAAMLYSQLTDAEPQNAAAWYRRGQATIESTGSTAEGRMAFEKALELGFPAGPALFGIARTHVTDGDLDAAMATLEGLAENGPSPFVVSQLAGDELFAPLSGNERFRGIVERLTPCMTEEYRQFDFWLGNWRVYGPQGQVVGTNDVTQAMDGCVLMESWTSALGGQKGMSINYYDRDKGTWSQIYRDNTGNVSQWPELVGGLVDGAMVLDSGPDSQPRSRWVWTKQDDGRVRQMAEQTTDGGETWTVVWDSYYELVRE